MTTQPTPITDKNGKQTTVHKRVPVAVAHRPLPNVSGTHKSTPEPYTPHDIGEMNRMIESLPAEEDTTLPNSHIRLMGILRDNVEQKLEAGYDFATAYESVRVSYYNAWIADYRGAIDSFESLAK